VSTIKRKEGDNNMDKEYTVEGNIDISRIKASSIVPKLTQEPPGSFPEELKNLINKHSLEGGSNTPDFILAEYLKQCLETFDMCVRKREEWYVN